MNRVFSARSRTSIRSNHFTHAIPNHPGTTSRTGNPCPLVSGCPFIS